MLTLSSGHSAEYLTNAVGAGRESYYTGAVAAGEPPGRWSGRGAEQLGLSGQVDAQDMTALYEHFVDPRDPGFKNPAEWAEANRLGHAGRRYATVEEIYAGMVAAEPDADPERKEQLRVEAGKKVRSNVAFWDATFSVQKSVTVLHAAFEAQEVAARDAGRLDEAAAWATHREAVESAIWAGNGAGLEYLAEKAGYSRVGHHGGKAGRFTDAHEWTIASFFQHDNRNHDPQLHIHNAILNRVQGADGKWRTLDSQTIHTYRPAAAAVAERVMEEHLTRALGVGFATRPDGKSREIRGIDQGVLDLFSTRRRAITAKTTELVAAYRDTFAREPNALELDRLQREATLATRAAKSHEGETAEARLKRWDGKLRAEVAGGLGRVADGVLDLATAEPEAPDWSPTAVLDIALAQVQEKKAAWTEADLARAVSDALPDYLGGLDTAGVRRLVDGLVAEGVESRAIRLTADGPGLESLPDDLKLADGRSVYDRPGGHLYATTEHVASEKALREAAIERGAPALDDAAVSRLVEELSRAGVELGPDQAAAVSGVLSSGARLEALVGPAGTGKSYVVGALAKAWTDPGLWGGQQRRVLGLATGQAAADVLAGEGVSTSSNIARWLAAQDRLDAGRRVGQDLQWQVGEGDLVVVDESAMTSTADLTAIRERVDAAGGKLLLCGDHKQLAAVGAGGGMELVAGAGRSYELAEARRFTHEWEASASLRLREGNPAALDAYRRHGRILDGGTAEQAADDAARGYVADTLAGKQSLLVVDTNEQAARVSADVRARLVRLGRVAEDGVPLGRDGGTAGVGDLVAARLNRWDLAGPDRDQPPPINRHTYRVEAVRDDGGLDVSTADGRRLVLPADYVAEHLELGYATTAYGAQGRTVDCCHALTSRGTSPRALYVETSRGRDVNTLHVITETVPEDAPPGAERGERSDPYDVLAGILDREVGGEGSALATGEESVAEAEAISMPGERFVDVAEQATAGRAVTLLDQLLAADDLDDRQRRELAADEDGMKTLSRVLRQAEVAGHDPHQVLSDAVAGRSLAGARKPAAVLHHRISENVDLDPVGDSYTDWTPTVQDPTWRRHLNELASLADASRDELGRQAGEQAPRWAVEALGQVPDEPGERAAWEHRAGIVAAHRELSGHDDPDTALPAPPKAGQVEARASWRAAWRALDRPAASRDEAEMSDGQLRARIRAWEREKVWEPDWVAPELAGTIQAEERHQQTARLRAAEAETAGDQAEKDRLETEARQAGEVAATLAGRRAELEQADRVRGLWYAHTAQTRTAAQRAVDELGARDVDLHPADTGSTRDWLTAHAEDAAADDVDRPVTDEADLAEHAAEADAAADLFIDRRAETAETGVADVADVRGVAGGEQEPARHADETDWTTTPGPDRTKQTIVRAQRALDELHARRDVENQQHEAEAAERDRAEQLARWHQDDQQTEVEASRDQERGLEPATPLD